MSKSTKTGKAETAPCLDAPGAHPGGCGGPGTGGRLLAAWTAISMVALVLLAWGCNSEVSSRPLSVAGSTSVQPFAEKLAEIYMHEHPGCRIDVQGGGSSAGIYAAEHGAADLGTSSRELVSKEKNLTEIPIAYDGIAIIVHPANPLTDISIEEIRRIFMGTVTNWQAFGLPAHAIHLITREEGSGTREAFEHLVMAKHEITPTALVQDSNGSVREIVAGDPHALGYISAGLVDERVKALAINGVLPTTENIKNHTYKLLRRFLLVSLTPPTGRCKEFTDFILSPKGQKILENEGLVGVK